MTLADKNNFVIYDNLVIQPLHQLGWTVEDVVWNKKDVDWNSYHLVIIRSTWDYQQNPQRFLHVLSQIESSQAWLENPLSLVKWNIDKLYLKDLEDSGVAIVPTLWPVFYNRLTLDDAFDLLECDEIIIKPRISANADNTYRVEKDSSRELAQIKNCFARRNFMIQPFIESVISPGEFSLFYFSGNYSHAVLKKPRKGDFRVQEEHGGCVQAIAPAEELVRAGKKLLEFFKKTPLYLRADFVKVKNSFALMEVELIEPSLYFEYDLSSASRFAAAIESRWRSLQLTHV